jgi:endonuclease/exonuclease/phosphatase (EEP) superfamily protein YafD
MKIVFLNTWNAKIRELLAEFIREQARDTDVFCFQEVRAEARALFADILSGHPLAGAASKYISPNDDMDQATYVRQGMIAGESRALFEREPFHCGLGLYTPVRSGDGVLHVVNFHGLAQPGAKRDDPDRLTQSRGIIGFCAGLPGPKIIGGDLNLMPDTESVRMFAGNGYRDLIANFKIPTTRNRLAWEKFPDDKQYYSDYVFVSPEIKVREFSVPRNEISDHLPMIVDVQI